MVKNFSAFNLKSYIVRFPLRTGCRPESPDGTRFVPRVSRLRPERQQVNCACSGLAVKFRSV